MNRRLLHASVVAFSFALVLAGCQKSADQQSASSATDANSSATGAASSSSAPDAAKSSEKRPEPPKPIVVPADTVLSVVLDQAVGSKISTPGQAFSATVQSPVEVDGRVAIPKGARASGVVKDAKSAGRFKGGAVLSLTLTSVTVKNEDYNIQTTAPSEASKGKGKRTAALIGGGAGGGALIGGLAGGGKGALIGAVLGGGAGTAGAAYTGEKEVVLPVESTLSFTLTEPLIVKL